MGDKKAAVLGLLSFVGAIPALVIPLIAGVLSDRCTHPWGRRRPYIAFGGVIALIGMVLLWLSASAGQIGFFFGSFFILQFGANVALAAYSGVIPDIVPEDQRGLASSYMAVMSQLSTLGGAFLAGTYISNNRAIVYGVSILVFAVFILISLSGIKERRLEGEQEPFDWPAYFRGLAEPFKSMDFTWVWITRALMMLGFYALQPYIIYYLKDIIGIAEPAKQATFVLAAILVAATISGAVGGAVSDRVGRKPVILVASLVIAVMCVAFPFLKTLEQVFAVGILFGIGYGTYISVDWALGTDVLPSAHDSGRDMAVWHVSMTLPQQIAPLYAGGILQAFLLRGEGEKASYGQMGYVIIFVISALAFFFGGLLIFKIKSVK